VKTFWLSLHVPYRCRDSGACCSSGWDIPVERARVRQIAALRSSAAWLRMMPNAPCDVAGVLAVGANGHCVFHSTHAERRGCEIQHAFGHGALPTACQHFPREVLIDRRGVSLTLSHYCPTAADLLFAHAGPVEIVATDRTAMPAVEGLDARDALPPSLTPAMLMDDEGYAAWEAHMIARLAGPGIGDDVRVEDCLAQLDADARALTAWRPGGMSLVTAIAQLSRGGRDVSPAAPSHGGRDYSPAALSRGGRDFSPATIGLFDLARAAVATGAPWPGAPDDAAAIWQRLVARDWPVFAPVVRRFLAAHAFASWTAYQGDGVLTMMRRLHLTLAVLRCELVRACAADDRPLDRATLTAAIRRTDLLVVHHADRARLARLLAPA
jgi:hypothetical protein